ncbi:MAG TPA: ABC transporter permease [Alphaproteobacteria bacterium]|nr:ABC transporter permease [Alphaproteobacteria bacterium]
MSTVIQDIRYALRQLRLSPAFTLTAVLTLALGMGANTAVFTLVHEILLKSLPVANPSGLYRVGDVVDCCVENGFQDDWTMFSYPLYEYLRANTPEFEQLAASQTNRPDLSVRREGGAAARSFSGELVSGNFFPTLGINAFAGRLISPEDDRNGAPPVAVLSYHAWQKQYGLDRSLVGSTLTVNGIAMTLVGIAPPGFYGDRRESDPPDLWMPIALEPALAHENSMIHAPSTNWRYLIGRLRPGTQLPQLSAHMTAELQQYLRVPENMGPYANPANLNKQVIHVTPGADGVNQMKDESQQGLIFLLAASGVILLIACANVANLLLARGTALRQRTSLLLAIGASRSRIIRARLTESVLLASLGGLAGLALAFYASRAMVLLAFRGAEYVPISTAPSLPVLGFTFAVVLLTGIIFGVAPAWMASRSDPAEALRGAGRSTRDSSALPQKSLVVAQAALSVALLTVAGLVTQSLRNLQGQDYGFERQGRLLVQFSPGTAGYTPERLPALYQKIEDQFAHAPGVISESLSLYTAQQGNNWGEDIHMPGRQHEDNDGSSWDRVSTHYFETIGTPVVRGRSFRDSDTATSQHVAVVNEAFVKKYFPNSNGLGEHFGKGEASHKADYEIVGVVKDAKYLNPARPVRPWFFVPLTQTVQYAAESDARVEKASLYMGTLELNLASDPNSFQPQARRILAAIDPNLTPLSIRTFDDQIELRTTQKALMSRLSTAFGLIALALASVGLYGLTTYQVNRRTGEIGLRMALGADRLNILKLVLRGAFLQVAIGLVLGIPLAFASRKLVANQLFGLGTFEPMVVTIAIASLLGCALVASVLPARRAAAIDPMKALRTD